MAGKRRRTRGPAYQRRQARRLRKRQDAQRSFEILNTSANSNRKRSLSGIKRNEVRSQDFLRRARINVESTRQQKERITCMYYKMHYINLIFFK